MFKLARKRETLQIFAPFIGGLEAVEPLLGEAELEVT